jgi:hypothetical protein
MLAIPKHRRLLGEAVRFKPKEAGLTQEKLAEKADLSTVFISCLNRYQLGFDAKRAAEEARSGKARGVRVSSRRVQEAEFW